EYGTQIRTAWLLTAPIDQTLVPAATLLDDSFLEPTVASLVWVVGFAVVMAASPLLRRGRTAAIPGAPVLATVVGFWITGTYVVPRFFSFLLVPLFILVATGCAAIFGSFRTHPAPVRTLVAAALLGFVAVESVSFLAEVPRQPREAT